MKSSGSWPMLTTKTCTAHMSSAPIEQPNIDLISSLKSTAAAVTNHFGPITISTNGVSAMNFDLHMHIFKFKGNTDFCSVMMYCQTMNINN